MQVCTVTLGDEHFGIGLARLREIVRPMPMAPVPLAPGAVAGLINLRGQIVLAIDLRRRLGMPPAEMKPMNVVIDDGGMPVSLLVDAVGDVCTIDDAQREPTPPNLDPRLRAMIAGVYKQEEGRLLLLIDEAAVLDVGEQPCAT